jgi:hypothetical protein
VEFAKLNREEGLSAHDAANPADKAATLEVAHEAASTTVIKGPDSQTAQSAPEHSAP